MLVATSCGRFGFGQHDPDGDVGGDTSDAAGPVAVPQFCDERTVTTLPGLDTVAIRAVALDMKYAVAIETTSNDIALLELDAQGALVATHAAFTPGYAPLYGIARHNELPVVSLFTGGAYYIKFVEAGWEAYGTGPSGDAHVIDPPYVEIDATRGIGGRISGDFNVGVIDDGDIASINQADHTPLDAVSGSIVWSPSGARVAVELAGGVCETFVVNTDGTTKALHTFSPCYAPKVAAVDDDTAAIVHRTDAAGPYAVHVVPLVSSDPGTTYPLTGATYARIAARVDGAIWVGHGSGSYRAMMRFANDTMTEHRENVPAYAFDLTERDAFWIEGAVVHVSTPCLR